MPSMPRQRQPAEGHQVTRCGWLVDQGQTVGGAELTQAEFRAAAPNGVEFVDCPPDAIDASCDRYVAHNCVTYSLEDLENLRDRPVVKYHHDVGPWLQPDVRAWLERYATNICCSPLQASYMGFDEVPLIPPPVDLERFAQAAERVNGNRQGNVCVGSWRNHGKAPHKVAQWGAEHGGVEFYGGGPLAPSGSREVAYEAMPHLLASYERFVFLPTVIEPFGRIVAEAWAAGCTCVVNDLVGAKYWITEKPEALETAASDFWQVVMNA